MRKRKHIDSIYSKQSTYKWTHSVLTRDVQGSSVLLLDVSLGVKLLSHGLHVRLASVETSKHGVFPPSILPPAVMQLLVVLHCLQFLFHQSLTLAFPNGAQYLAVLLIYASLVVNEVEPPFRMLHGHLTSHLILSPTRHPSFPL